MASEKMEGEVALATTIMVEADVPRAKATNLDNVGPEGDSIWSRTYVNTEKLRGWYRYCVIDRNDFCIESQDCIAGGGEGGFVSLSPAPAEAAVLDRVGLDH